MTLRILRPGLRLRFLPVFQPAQSFPNAQTAGWAICIAGERLKCDCSRRDAVRMLDPWPRGRSIPSDASRVPGRSGTSSFFLPMLATLEPHSAPRAAVFAQRRSPLGLLCAVFAGGLLAVAIGYWMRTTNDTAAAYKAWHHAHDEFGDGRATLDAVCAASRRCCLAQCSVPRPTQTGALDAHLKRIDALRPAEVPANDEATAADHRSEIWRIYHDEALLWVKLGKPK